MTASDTDPRKVFFELHEGLPRQSCGSAASTLRALEIVAGRLPAAPRIADLACGPGSSAIPLARTLPGAQILALDLYAPFIEETAQRAETAGVGTRVKAITADMMDAPIEANIIDMVWCEGGIYNVGVEAGLRQWAEYLRPGGVVVFNEPIWLKPEETRTKALTDFWSAYPGMTDDAGVLAQIKTAGFEVLRSFDLPESDWWDEYYLPMEAKLDVMEATYAGDASAAIPLTGARTEIAMRRQYADHYNYRFYCTALAT